MSVVEKLTRVFLTPAELAARWHVGVETVRRWCRSGKIESFKSPGNGRRLISMDVIVAFEKSEFEGEDGS